MTKFKLSITKLNKEKLALTGITSNSLRLLAIYGIVMLFLLDNGGKYFNVFQLSKPFQYAFSIFIIFIIIDFLQYDLASYCYDRILKNIEDNQLSSATSIPNPNIVGKITDSLFFLKKILICVGYALILMHLTGNGLGIGISVASVIIYIIIRVWLGCCINKFSSKYLAENKNTSNQP